MSRRNGAKRNGGRGLIELDARHGPGTPIAVSLLYSLFLDINPDLTWIELRARLRYLWRLGFCDTL